MRGLLAVAFLCALSTGCMGDQGKGDLHAAVSRCFGTYPFRKGTAYDRFTCITNAHLRYGPNAVGAQYDLISQIDMASLRIGLDVDAGTLSVPEAETELRWITIKARTRPFSDRTATRSQRSPAWTTKSRPTDRPVQHAPAEPTSQTAYPSAAPLTASGV